MSNHAAALSKDRFAFHVVPVDRVWKVAMPGDSVPVSLHADKQAAIARALELARRAGGLDVLVCRTDGSIETEFSTSAVA
ncbi:MAG TPA: DUF2188 domain-containing protein [Minicystis sp.]|nr:DUF2188 domain-containing protein [Minicystis sp.]